MSCTWLNPIAAPFALLLMALYKIFQGSPDHESKFAYALALLCIAIIVRVLLLPVQMKSKRGMLKQTRLQPKLAELQKRHGANKQKLNEEMAKLYKDEGVNPASGCLWSFIQMPIMIALFYAIRQPFTLMMRIGDQLWSEVSQTYNESGLIFQKLTELNIELPDPTNFYAELFIAQDISINWDAFKDLGVDGLWRISFFLGNVNLAEIPNWKFFWSPETDWTNGAWVSGFILFLLPIISGGMQFVSSHIMQKSTPKPAGDSEKAPGGNLMKFMPLMSVWFGFILPAALSVYWTIGTVLQIAQDTWLNKKYTKILDAEDAEKTIKRMEKEAELEAKRLETERMKAEGLAAENRNTSKRKKQSEKKQGQREKAAEWERKHAPVNEKEEESDPSRVGNRRFARGRAYDPDRYGGVELDEDDGEVSDSEVSDGNDDRSEVNDNSNGGNDSNSNDDSDYAGYDNK